MLDVMLEIDMKRYSKLISVYMYIINQSIDLRDLTPPSTCTHVTCVIHGSMHT